MKISKKYYNKAISHNDKYDYYGIADFDHDDFCRAYDYNINCK